MPHPDPSDEQPTLHDLWLVLRGPRDPVFGDLWWYLVETHCATCDAWPAPLRERVTTMIDEPQVPQTPAEWHAFGRLLAEIDAVLEQP